MAVFLTFPGDDTLRDALGAFPAERTVLHEWPLSRIERIRTDDGKTVILKVQRTEASVERRFYRNTAHPVLLRPLSDGVCGSCDWMLLPDLGDTAEDWTSLSDEGIRARVRELQKQFAAFTFTDSPGTRTPVFRDFSSPERIREACREIAPVLDDGESTADALLRWAEEDAPRCFGAQAGLVHGDLKGENVLAAPDGLRVIDWQRPMLAPLAVEEELALLLAGRESRGPYAALARFFEAWWYAWAYQTCLPLPFVAGMAQKYARTVPET